MAARPPAYAIKAAIDDAMADRFVFEAQKTMYGGKQVQAGDPIFLFASETDGGSGLIGRGIVTASEPVARTSAARQTPCVTLLIERHASAVRALGRAQLKPFRTGADGTPEGELDFKLYRQATNKVVGLTEAAATFLDSCF